MADLSVTVGADISAYKAGMQQVGSIAASTSNEVTKDLANAAKSTENLGGSAQSASMRFMQMRSGISAARDGVMAFTLGGQAAERSLMAMGHHMNSLINETGSVRGAFSALASSLIGPGGVILAITLAAELWSKYKDSQKQAAEEQTAYQKAVEASNSNAAKEISTLQSLYEAATNANIPMSQRIEAVKQLQAEYPSYFANMSQEAILAGKAATAYDNLTQSIINQAVVKAGQERLQEAIKPLVDIIAEQERLKVQIDKNNAEAQAKNPNRVLSTGAAGQTGFREVQVTGHTNQGAMQTFVEDQTKEGLALHGATLQTMEQHKSDLQKGIKEAAATVQQMVKDFGINSLIDPDKMKKGKEAVTGIDLLREQLKEAQNALQDSIVAGKTDSSTTDNPLVKRVHELQVALDKAIDTYNILLGLEGRNAPIPTNTGLGSQRGFGQGLDNGGLQEDSGVRQFTPDQLGNAGLGKTNDEVVASMQKEVKAFSDLTEKKYQDALATEKIKEAQQRLTQVTRIFGSGLETVFANALNGTQNFVKGMVSYLEQLIVKFIAAAAAAAILNALTGGTMAGFSSIFGQLSGLSSIFGSTKDAGGGGFNIPTFATGAIVNQPTLGIFGERGPEAIVTPEHLADFAGVTQGQQQPQTLSMKLQGSNMLLFLNRANKTKSRTS